MMKSITRYALLLSAALASGSCNKWLDGAQPKDQNLDEFQYSSEEGINSALNGFYRTISAENLYGGVMTMTAVELLAHYYYYEEELLNNGDFTYFNYMSTYMYGDDVVKNPLSGVWSASYSAIFHINNFIDRVAASTILTDDKKSMALGEAYGLRAFLHLDLFRLFGSEAQKIPYNTSAEVIPHDAKAPDEFFGALLHDIEQAKELLKNDPIITLGVRDLTKVEPTDNLTEKEIFDSYLRNYRMNYYAVLALQARALMFKGDTQGAAAAAESVISPAGAPLLPFGWADKNKVVSDRNFIFYSEVIFGVYNLDLYTTWEKYTNGSRQGSTYAVGIDNLHQNIFRFDNTGGDVSLWEDVRVRQWMPSTAGTGLYVSYKFANFVRTNANDPISYFQPLIRMSEMYYILIEHYLLSDQVAAAVSLLNTVRARRGSQQEALPDPNATAAEQAFDMLEAEYYKEFYAEGQVYFYLKRRKSDKIFDPNRQGKVDVSKYSPPTGSIYLIPLPESETNL
jgi:hypothetical protein